MREFKKWIRISHTKPKKKIKNWRFYRNFFLRKKRLHVKLRIKHFFNNALIFKKYYKNEYILKTNKYIKYFHSLCVKKTSNKLYNFFHRLNFRLPKILLNSHLVLNKLESNSIIKKGFVSVNNKVIKHLNYILQLHDLIYLYTTRLQSNQTLAKIFLKRVRKFRLRRRRKFRRKFLGRCLLKNLFEINYRTRSLIYISILSNISLIKRRRKWIRKKNINLFEKKKTKPIIKYYNIFNLQLIKKFWGFL